MKISYLHITFVIVLLIESTSLALLRQKKDTFFSGEELTSVLAVIEETDSSSRRPYDSLNFVKADPGTLVRNGDFLRTEDSPMTLRLHSEDTTVVITPHSLVRISIQDQKIKIELRQGDFKITSGKSGNVATSKDKTEKEKEIAPTEEPEKVLPKGNPFYPAKDSILLFFENRQISVFLSGPCESGCHAQLWQNDSLLSEAESSSSPLKIDLPLDDSRQGIYRWTLESSEKTEEGSFEVYRYSEDLMKKFINDNKNVELIF